MGDETRALVARAKSRLRDKMRGLRRALPPSAARARSERVVGHLAELSPLAAAGGVALFWPMLDEREVDLRDLDRCLRERQRRIYYPFMDPTRDGYRTGFRRVDDIGSLTDRGRGFAEPPSDAAEASAGEIDVVVVPALAMGQDGHRLGYGSGFYDATLPDVCPPAISVCVGFSFQLIVEVPHETRDVRCHWVVTDERVIDVAGS